ncbi:transaldolase/glucose-6-phosphate isomerase [Methylorubrum pseudosasae]|nr:transaldolase/glucose-6-phosphate isomerase [Methylorubrum pseudosasae]
MNALNALFAEHEQAVWLDFVARGFIAKGELQALVEKDDLRGVTSNPAIFEKAIGHSAEYDDSLKAVLSQGDARVIDLYEGLAIADIQAAADVLRRVYDTSDGADGYVSLEVSPYLALDTEETLNEALRLHAAVGRDNLMVKVPATPAGLPAIRQLTAEGISVNITLLFSQSVYEEVANAFIDGLTEFGAKGGDVSKVASVASFFISRIDSLVDKKLDEVGGYEDLKGKVAIANAKLAYQRYKRIFAGPKWAALEAKGAKAQRLLWASTGTKNKAYSDVLYVEELIGKNTVNTMPPATMDAFRDHGRVRATLEENIGEAETVMARLAEAGIDIEAVARQLVEEGVQLFVDAADALLGAVAGKRAALLDHRLDAQTFKFDEPLQAATDKAVESWRASGAIRRLWAHDATVWTGRDEGKWLGWLRIVEDELERVDLYESFAEEVRAEGFTDAVVLGMGGSSLGPEVISATYGHREGFPKLRILDSTDPDEVRAVEAAVNLETTLFIVASKSGSTLEPNVFRDYFLGRMKDVVGADKAGRHFVAVTDPGSAMEKAARDDGFRKIFLGVPQIGGRYSVLSAFGLVPAAAAGVEIREFLDSARMMVRSCGPAVPPAVNPGVRLGAAMGVAAKDFGRDKITIIASPGIGTFGTWAEQLIAESTGKEGVGIIPVEGEPVGVPAVYGEDRLFVYLRLTSQADARQDEAVKILESEAQPVVRIDLDKVGTAPAGILPLRDRDRRGRGGARHQPVRPARCRGEQDRDEEAVRQRRGDRRPAGRDADLRGRDGRALRRCGQRRGPALRRGRRGDRGRASGAGEAVRLRRRARLCGAQRGASRGVAGSPADGARRASGRDLPGIRPALPPLDRAGLQGRSRFRRVPPDHCRPLGRSADPRAQARVQDGDRGAGAGRFRRAVRAQAPGAENPRQGR